MADHYKIFIEMLFSISIILFGLGYWILRLEVAGRKWPQVPGVITKSTTEGGPKETRPVIEYEFKYQGQSYKTSHWRPGNFTMGDKLGAKAVTSRYWAGQPVMVFVNTRQPEASILEAKPSLCWVPFMVGIGFFLMAIAVLIVTLLNQRRMVG